MPAPDLPGWVAAWSGPPQWQGVSLVPRADLPVLFAAVEHRAWVAQLLAFLHGSRSGAPVLDGRLCQFGRWLGGAGASHLTRLAALGDGTGADQLTGLHQQLHDLALHLVGLKTGGQTQALQTQLPRLTELRDAVLAQLGLLLGEPALV
ncbi:hypothetical protein GALL_539430 [mine drainage metagenome]|uniref:Chemoreceptor zinc-binding domain-containing protein n=1 Tax=mine drainage metagenome TaxID=410659 RepID=A0A1J5P0D9_9ZZZZ